MPGLDVTETSIDYQLRFPDWRDVRDVLAGERQVKRRQTLYLPKPKGQKINEYARYLERAHFYGVSERTLRGLTGMVFRREPDIQLPSAVEFLRDKATIELFDLEAALREAVREVASMGRHGVLVDRGVNPNDPVYLATYNAEQIINWEERMTKTTDGDARRMVTRVVLKEEPETNEERTRTFLRELLIDENGIYVQRLWEEEESEMDSSTIATTLASLLPQLQLTLNEAVVEFVAGNFMLVDERVPTRFGQPMREIPFWFINPFDLRARTTKPPFQDMAAVNLAHYRNSADYEQAVHLTAHPTPFIFGVSDEDVPRSIGGVVWHSPNPDTRAGIIEVTGQGAETTRKAMEDKENRMAVLGARIIKDFTRDNVSAEQARLEARAENSILVSSVQMVDKGYSAAVNFANEWEQGRLATAQAESASMGLNIDFDEMHLDANELRELVAGWQAGAYSYDTLFRALKRGELIEPGVTAEQERRKIERDAELMGLAPGESVEDMVERLVAERTGGNGNGGGGGEPGTGEGEEDDE